ncbi:MAG: NrpR regulatory domain-containing protein [Thermodesulfovibrionales bacterium]|nr:NrpR regulatory domain-containing protein [Thermodesulfovibrionales bacterium]
MNKTMLSILKVLDKHNCTMGSKEISKELKFYGIDLTERTVRYHLRILDERGYTEICGREGRKITEKGRDELKHSLVSLKVGFVISKIEALSYQTTLNLDSLEGNVILNVSYFPTEKFKESLKIMKPVFSSPFIMSDRMILAKEGELIGDLIVPKGMVGIGTVCSVTINGVFLKAGIPVTSRFGGVLEVEKRKPKRFISLISYEGSSLDPLEIFISSRMTNVNGAVKKGAGKILASFREIPAICAEEAKGLAKKMSERGIKGILMIGDPNKPLLEIDVGIDKVGLIVVGGLNPIAAIHEANIPTESKAMSTLFEYSKLLRFNEIEGEAL